MFSTATASLSALMLIGTVAGLGINCRGSGLCTAAGSSGASMRNLGDAISLQIAQGHGGDYYNEGKQIACTINDGGQFPPDGRVCAFFQFNGASGNLQAARNYVQELIDHDCHVCGSVPTGEGNPDVSTGALTVNYVDSPCDVAGKDTSRGAYVCTPE